jgi:multiple sugar transport system substrate-binding protein
MKLGKRPMRLTTTLVIGAVTTTLVLSGWSSSLAGATPVTSGKCNNSAFTSAKINWKQQSGKTITLAVEEHPWWETVKPQIACFEKLTGITVKTSVLGEDQFVTKLPIELAGGATTPDVFMINQFGQASAAGWLQSLDSYLKNPKLTDSKWFNVNDFFAGARKFAEVNGHYFAMPITAEAQMLFVRSDLVKKVPTTISALLTAAAAADKNGVAGFGSRAVASPSETPWPFGGFAFSDGGQYLDSSGKPHLNSAANVTALNQYSKLIHDYGAAGASSWGFLQNEQAMEQGKLAMWTDSSTLLGALKNPKVSKFASRINAYPFPVGTSGKSLPNAWYWTIGINSKSQAKDASWLFLQWATSLPISELGAANGASPARAAAWKSKQASAAIGVANAAQVEKAIASVDSSYLANAWKNALWSQIATPLAQAINSAVTNGSAGNALSGAQAAAKSILGK